MRDDYDLILVGGGLANGLIAWRLAQTRPELRLLLLEQGPALGGNHTWSFHQHDLSEAQFAWLRPLVTHEWPWHMVHFPERQRRLHSGYASLGTARFDAVLRDHLHGRVRLETPVTEVTPSGVTLAGGERLRAAAVIDGRGPRDCPQLVLGYQKFLGQEVRLQTPHGLQAPLLMDACVEQHDGYRFVYLLPLAPDRLLIEDTYYADGAQLGDAALRQRITAYAEARGWRIAEVLREERGVLPIVLGGDLDAFLATWQGVPRSGLAAALFHATTGYSLPHAVQVAERIATLPVVSTPALLACLQDETRRAWRRQGFFRLLNRMLFLAGEPDRRWRVMQRFYGLPEPLIQRFYAGRPSLADRLRILSGKPPVPVMPALRAAFVPLPRQREHS